MKLPSTQNSCSEVLVVQQIKMQSIFTYEPDPPRVSSPWRTSGANETHLRDRQSLNKNDSEPIVDAAEYLNFDTADELALDKLDAEPQDGPTEYKVHLLLRPRRTIFASSTGRYMGGSQHARSNTTPPRNVAENIPVSASPLSHSNSTRQHRLEQLTTQLLWRLQQSSPLHTTSASNLILPSLPEASGDLLEPREPAKLLPGLEESNGALYEIGVSDDGSFVGLTRDEMNESLNNLQAMAASLGCITEVLRTVRIGTAECVHGPDNSDVKKAARRLEDVFVAEVYVKPVLNKSAKLSSDRGVGPGDSRRIMTEDSMKTEANMEASQTAHEQLRVTLTGATTSGKSSLLGTLSMSTLDNGHGKSRLSLLKHRHELASGMTSSVTQELVGYRADSETTSCIVNYASSNVSSWNDIHSASRSGRLALVSDSAGHPRYRRTTVRGLLGWAPHWTMICFPANDDATASHRSLLQPAEGVTPVLSGASAHISMAQLDLCLRLDLPLVVVVTKLDTASKIAFRQVLSTLLSSLKSSGKKPVLLANDSGKIDESKLQDMSDIDEVEIKRVVSMIENEGPIIVPIVFTSAVRGTGIGKIHALLRHLPIQSNYDKMYPGSLKAPSSRSIFRVDDFFKLNARATPVSNAHFDPTAQGSVISGHLSRGDVTVGQELLLGPFSPLLDRSQDDNDEQPSGNADDPFLTPRSFTDALAKVTAAPVQASSTESEWRRVRVISIRNLRLPVNHLSVDRVGTLGIIPLGVGSIGTQMTIRRGMVLTNMPLEAAHTLTAAFDMSDASSLVIGNRVAIYTASVRSSAKVVAIALHDEHTNSNNHQLPQEFSAAADDDLAFAMDEEKEMMEPAAPSPSVTSGENILITLQLDSYREWVEVGAKLLIMPGGGPGLHAGERGIKGLAGLEGFVGSVVETFGYQRDGKASIR